MVRESKHLQQQLTHEQEAANTYNGTNEMEEENHLDGLVSPILAATHHM